LDDGFHSSDEDEFDDDNYGEKDDDIEEIFQKEMEKEMQLEKEKKIEPSKLDIEVRRSPKLFFSLKNGKKLSIWKTLLFDVESLNAFDHQKYFEDAKKNLAEIYNKKNG